MVPASVKTIQPVSNSNVARAPRPGAFFARGLWCYADGLEGTMDSYGRVKGPKELVVVRGPHAFATWPDRERDRVAERMIAYARAVTLGATARD